MTINRARYNSTTTVDTDVPITASISNIPSNPIPVYYSPNNGPGQDAFGRIRVSEPISIFESRATNEQYVNLFWDFKTIGVASSASVVTASAYFEATISGTAGDYVAAQTRQYMRYQAGKSSLFFLTFNFSGSTEGVVKRVGIFDDKDGHFLELSGSKVSLVERSSTNSRGDVVVETKVSQSLWAKDKFDGTGLSGYALNLTASTFFALDYEWLGVGSVRAGLLGDDGALHYVHQFDHVNNFQVPYIRTANLPIRVEVSASVNSERSGLKAFCIAYTSEGGHNPAHILRAVDRGTTALTTDTTLRSLIQVRLKDGYRTNINITNMDMIVTTANPVNFRWALLLNPTFNTTGAAPSWVSLLSSSMEYDISSTYSITNQGVAIASGYAASTSRATEASLDTVFRLGNSINGFKDTYVLSVQGTSGGNQTYLGGVEFEEDV